MIDGVSKINKQKNNGEKVDNPSKGDANSIGLPSLPFDIMYRGYFPLWRKIRDWGWYKDPITKAVFLELLLLSNHKKTDYMGHTIFPGQCVTGRKKLSADLGISEQTIRTSLKKLKSTNEITIENCNKFSIITLNNYFKYTKSTSEITGNQPATNQQLTTPNNGNNLNTKKERHKPPTLPLCKDYFIYLKSDHLEAEKFFDHFSSNGWKVAGKAPMKDWMAAARNWVRRAGISKPKCEKCKGIGKYSTPRGYEQRCDCPAGPGARLNNG